jgi:hypothetical protein
MTPTVLGTEAAALAVEANTTPRMRHMALMRAYVGGQQYDGRPKWHDKSVAVWEREPCVIWQAAEGAITSNEDLLLGEGRYPALSSRPEEDDGDESKSEELDEEASKKLDKCIKAIEREAKLRAHNREQYRNAQSVGTCVGIFGVKQSRLVADVVNAEHCTAITESDGVTIALQVQYPYIDISRDSQGKWQAKAFIFRRVIDSDRDVTFLPGEARQDGKEPIWTEDITKSVTHSLGFCPVIWHKFRTVSHIANELDGKAIHATCTDEMDAYNVEASIRHDGAVYSLPQKWETGVDPGYNPTDDTVIDRVPGTSTGGRVDPINNPQTATYSTRPKSGSTQGKRKQGPGHVWQYSNPDTKVGQLELNAGALESLANTMADLRSRICETLAWVPLNQDEVHFAAGLSGKAMERIMARQINRVAKDRDGFGEAYIIKAYTMLLRIAEKVGAELKTRHLKDALPVIAKFAGLSADWSDPPLTLMWGPWFTPAPEDTKFLIDAVIALKQDRLITRETAVRKIAPVVGIEDVPAYMEALEEEDEALDEKEAQETAKAISSMHAGLNGTDPGKRTANPKSNAQGGSGGASSVAGNSTKGGSGKPAPR